MADASGFQKFGSRADGRRPRGPPGSDPSLPETVPVVVSPDPKVPAGKHRLSNRWTLWHANPKTLREEGANVIWLAKSEAIETIDTLEDFFCLLAATSSPSELLGHQREQHEYLFFREGVRAVWEDPHVKDGGRWTIDFSFSGRETKKANVFHGGEVMEDTVVDIDDLWLRLLTSVVIGDIDGGVCVAGCRIVRKVESKKAEEGEEAARTAAYRLEVWTLSERSAGVSVTAEDVRRVGVTLRTLIGMPEGLLKFKRFSKAKRFLAEISA